MCKFLLMFSIIVQNLKKLADDYQVITVPYFDRLTLRKCGLNEKAYYVLAFSKCWVTGVASMQTHSFSAWMFTTLHGFDD